MMAHRTTIVELSEWRTQAARAPANGEALSSAPTSRSAPWMRSKRQPRPATCTSGTKRWAAEQ